MARLSATVTGCSLIALAGCDQPPPPAPPPPPVEVVTLSARPVANIIELPGRVQAVRTAEVRARVDGIVERRLYAEGTDVRAGQPLFRIDPREMQAAYASAVAALNRARAAATNAGQVVGRYRPLVREQAISGQEYDAAVAQQRGGQADVAEAGAAVDRARLNLAYASVTAPISGRVGRAEVTEGALVSASGATLMTRIEQLDPIYVNFSQSSSELLRLRRDIAAGRVVSPALNRVQVRLILEDGTEYGPVGHLNFLDMSVDENTGTVSLRAQFPNPQRYLLPGQFVRARIEGGTTQGGLLVPQRAVQVSPKGASVMVVGRDDVAMARPIEVGDLQGDNWVVRSGLKAGERVIVNGLQKVRPGGKVTVLPARGGPQPASAAR
ncbi:efflux RND transporter periplasmic adaptor subunit [Sphingomonas oleivorans]|uniref:efflux RND transporter periplasmic adaptor subunit n=1 Tax=Sphingomonas oleivorans TaxID=1735121 RepID=UPI001FAFEFAD|nr:efflux RND transporter periplasmic adaptor subunit [Sphingomonas oleivorans]